VSIERKIDKIASEDEAIRGASVQQIIDMFEHNIQERETQQGVTYETHGFK